MKRISCIFYKPATCLTFCLLLANIVSFAGDDDGNIDGKSLFQNNCSVCHTWDKEIVGPALGSIGKKREKDWLVDFIKSSQSLIQKGDPHAIFLFEQYKHNVMPDFDELSKEQIIAIISYLQKQSEHDYTSLSLPERYDPGLINGDVLHGKRLFEDLCVGCHALRKEVFGPALVSVTKTRPREWLHNFIRNSKAVIDSGDPYAQFLYNQYNKKRMYAFKSLKTEDIDAILLYIRVASESPSHIEGVNGQINENYEINKTNHEHLYTHSNHKKSDFRAFRSAIGMLMSIIVASLLCSLIYFYRILSTLR